MNVLSALVGSGTRIQNAARGYFRIVGRYLRRLRIHQCREGRPDRRDLPVGASKEAPTVPRRRRIVDDLPEDRVRGAERPWSLEGIDQFLRVPCCVVLTIVKAP